MVTISNASVYPKRVVALFYKFLAYVIDDPGWNGTIREFKHGEIKPFPFRPDIFALYQLKGMVIQTAKKRLRWRHAPLKWTEFNDDHITLKSVELSEDFWKLVKVLRKGKMKPEALATGDKITL